jgi:hypothetical protein
MALNTSKKIVRHSWDAIPMPDLVIDRVNALGRDQLQQMTFIDRDGRLIGDIEIPGVDADEGEDFYQAEPDVVAAIMTQLSIKARFKEWEGEAFTVAQSEMNQLHFRNTFKPKLWR